MLNVLAQELNSVLAGSSYAELLSDMGKRMYCPKGIIAQSNEAKQLGKRANATIGITVNDGQPVILPEVQAQLRDLTPSQTVLHF